MKVKSIALKRVLTSFLAMTMVVTAFTGCGKKKTQDSLVDDARKSSKDYVFKSEKMDGIGDQENAYLDDIYYVGDRIYILGSDTAGNKVVYSFNTDGEDLKTYTVPAESNEYFSEVTFDLDGNMYAAIEKYADYEEEDGEAAAEGASDTEAVEGEDNSFDVTDNKPEEIKEHEAEAATEEASDSAVEESSEEVSEEASDDASFDEAAEDPEYSGLASYEQSDEMYVAKFDNTGKLLFKKDLYESLGVKAEDGAYIYVDSFVYTDAAGLLLSTEDGIYKCDADCNFTQIYKGDGSTGSYSLYNGFNNHIFVSYYGDTGLELSVFDPEKGTIGEKSAAIKAYSDYQFFGGKGYDLYCSTSEGVFGYDLASDSLTKLMDFMDSDLEVQYAMNSFVAVSDVLFFAVLPDFEYNYYATKLTKVPADQVKDRQIITLAGSNINYYARKAAINFNQNNSDYKIKIVDYSTYNTDDDWQAGARQFNLDIVAGNTPDVMIFESTSPVDTYINKGVCADIMPMLQNDPDLKDVKFLDNVMEAFKTGDKLYRISPQFRIISLAAKTSVLGGKDVLTIDDCENIIKQAGTTPNKAFGLYDKMDFLNMGLYFAGDKYIDWENKKCNFNSQEFVQFLEFANQFPSEITDDMYESMTSDDIYRTGEALFSYSYLYEFGAHARNVQAVFGEDVTYCGFPNAFGANCSVIDPEFTVAISASTKIKDGAWAFVKSLLTDDYQSKIEYDFPIRADYFDKVAEDSTVQKYYTDEDGKQVEDYDYYYIGDQEIKIKPLTKEEAENFKNYVKSVDCLVSYNDDVYQIIEEEASAYFSGQKSAQEVADIIQSRVSIYVNENS